MMLAMYSLILFVISVSCDVINGLNYGPSYMSTCRNDDGCTAAGMSCFIDYQGCDSGLCGCKYGTRSDGSCVDRDEGDECTSHDQCPRGLECHENRCSCIGRMLNNNIYCQKPWELLLGDKCGSGQTCLQKREGGADFVTSEVSCVNAVCKCRLGLQADGWTCRRLHPDEHGCITNADCSGDSICDTADKYCRCPAKHKVVASGKCGRNDASTNLQQGQTCDEMLFKSKFCASGLDCVRCEEDANYKCRKYKSDRPGAGSSSNSIHTSFLTSWITWLLCYLSYHMHYS